MRGLIEKILMEPSARQAAANYNELIPLRVSL
jgi:hypothetical protein